MTYHPHWNYPNEELVRLYPMSDDPLVRLLAERLDQASDELDELEQTTSDQAEEIESLKEQIESLNKEIEDLYEKQAA